MPFTKYLFFIYYIFSPWSLSLSLLAGRWMLWAEPGCHGASQR